MCCFLFYRCSCGESRGGGMFTLKDVRVGVLVGSYVCFLVYVVIDLAERWGGWTWDGLVRNDLNGLMLFCFFCLAGLLGAELYMLLKSLLLSVLEKRKGKKSSSSSVLSDPDGSIDPDGVFYHIKISEAAKYQSCFEFFAKDFDLDSKSYGDSLSDNNVDCVIQQIEIAKEKGVRISFPYVMVLLEQYIDADQIQRQIHKKRWLEASIESQSSEYLFMPHPGPVLKAIMGRYFPKG